VRNNIINIVEEEALEKAMIPEPSPEADVEVQPPLVDPPVKRKKGLVSWLEDVIQSAPSDSTASDSTQKKEDIKNEISNYICLGVKSSENPLQRWLDHGRHFPILSRIAKKYLCIPATSVPSERAFSVAECIVNEKWSYLLLESVNSLVFLAANLD